MAVQVIARIDKPLLRQPDLPSKSAKRRIRLQSNRSPERNGQHEDNVESLSKKGTCLQRLAALPLCWTAVPTSDSCVTDAMLPERLELIRFHVFLAQLVQLCRLDRIHEKN